MCVIVSLKIVLDATATTLSQMESETLGSGKSRDESCTPASDSRDRSSAEQVPRLWKRPVPHPGDQAQGIADPFWAGGRAAPAAAEPAPVACYFAPQSAVWLR